MADVNTRAFQEVLDEYMNDIADGIFFKSQKRLTEPHQKIFKSGNIKQVVTTDKGTLLKTANVNRNFLQKQIVYPAPHASDVEYGNGGINPDYDEIRSWVKRKIYDNRVVPDRELDMVTKRIIESLKRRGQSSDPFLMPSVLEEINELERST